jgi:type 1 glutamine amidotransferase
MSLVSFNPFAVSVISDFKGVAMPANGVFLVGLGRPRMSYFSALANDKPRPPGAMASPPFARAIFWLSVWLTACVCNASSTQPSGDAPAFAALLFTKTAGFRHESIPAGVQAIKSLGAKHHFHVEASEDATVFTDANLGQYQVVIFLHTTGDILEPDQQQVFERFIRNGGGFVGLHSATDTEYDWSWYGRLVGTYFDNHPAIQRATMTVVDSTHVSTKQLPATWIRIDEWYNFRDDPSPNVNVLIKIDETTYAGGGMGENHPISWCHQYDGGRAWYTAMGHTVESYSEPLFLIHVLGGIMWAAGVTPK